MALSFNDANEFYKPEGWQVSQTKTDPAKYGIYRMAWGLPVHILTGLDRVDAYFICTQLNKPDKKK